MKKDSLLALIFFLAVSALMTYPLIFNLPVAIDDVGDPFFNAWTLAWNHHQLFHDPLHLFDANIFYPNKWTLAYSEHQFASALLSLPVYLSGGNPIFASNFVLFLSFVLGGWGVYLLVRNLTGRAAAGIVSGLIFAFSSYRFSQLPHLQILTTQWMPFALLYLHRAFETKQRKHFILFGFFLLLQLLTSNYLGLIFMVSLGVFVAGFLLIHKSRFGWNGFRKLFVTFAVAGIIFLPFVIPYMKVKEMQGLHRSMSDLKQYSAQAENYLGVAGNHKWYPPFFKSFGDPERQLFFGFAAMALALTAFFLPQLKKNKERWVYLAVLVLCFLLSMGSESKIFGISLEGWPYKFFYYLMPGFDGMRVPSRFALMVGLCLAVLAGFGFAGLQARFKKKTGVMALTALFSFVVLAEGWSVPIRFHSFTAKPPEVHTWLKDQDDVRAVLHLPAFTGTSVHLEMNYVYWSAWHWKKMLNGYSGFFPPGWEELKIRLRDFPSKETIEELRAMGVNYIVVNLHRYAPELKDRFEKGVKRHAGDLEPVKQFETIFVYRLKEKG